ncbi:Anaerobic sulfite reductase subunit B [Rubripirellula tenax]|uniref:Anaerobic sulfite reductase subunit B n=1 Tax=Rubripirellula tenax TaxID=2528015 RepID=A0A5C6ESM6_9BACT|nr:FAD/NAD(P)-binding protein [Rubripirellula tenax]TWU50576.1 Anaerobic sulfite reductase subunit B [Rubripirellula tenax]
MLSPQVDPWTIASAKIVEMHDETPGVTTYYMELSASDAREAYSSLPGQFNMLYLPGVGESAISLSRLASPGDPLVHTVRAVGNVTQSLARLTPGDSIGIRGPFGSHWPIEDARGNDLVLVAGGIGLAPLRPVIEHVTEHRDEFGRVSLLIGARTPADLLYADQYDAWSSCGINVQTTVDRALKNWNGHVGVVTLLLNRLSIEQPSRTVLFCCGPDVMMTYAIRAVRERGIPRDNLWLSLERNMNCAIGHCGHCQLGPYFICKDGPVLRYDQVNRLMRVDSL